MSDPYEVVVTREDSDWLADVPTIAGAHTFARSLESLLRSVREVIVLMDDLPDEAQVNLVVRYEVDDDLVVAAADLGRRRREHAAREAELIGQTAALAQELVAKDHSVRDTAALLNITPGRVSQLVRAKSA